MANEENLAILNQGVEVWNEWREKNPEIILDLREADLWKADLSGANLSRADLRGAYLRGAYLSRANLGEANLGEANLSRANLSTANLSRANLSTANLSRANLSTANLSRANLSTANLSGVNFLTTQALATNFQGSTLTGACLEDWHINSQTNLEGVICDYVYLKANQQERRPHDPNKNFAPGEFTKLFQKVRETVDLIFSDGIDWQAFLVSFQQLQEQQKLKVESGEQELPVIRAIENKDDGTFVIRVSVPSDSDKAEVEQYLKREYEIQLKAIEEKYRSQLQAKNEQIEIYKQNSADIMKMAELVAKVSNPTIINVEAKAMAESESKGIAYNQSGKFGIGHMSGGEIKEGAKVAGIINEAEQQNLAEAAAEIQQLLEQLSQTYPTSTNKEKMAVVAEAVDQIERDLTLKARVINALKAGGTEAFKEAINHPLVNILMATLEGWQEAE